MINCPLISFGENEKGWYSCNLFSFLFYIHPFAALCFQFVNVLNSKKAKLRELRDQLSNQGAAENPPEEEEVSTDGTEPYVSGSDDVNIDERSDKDISGTSKNASPGKARGRKRNTRS